MPMITHSFTLSSMLNQDSPQRVASVPCDCHHSTAEDVTESTTFSIESDNDDDSIASYEISGKYGWFFNKNGKAQRQLESSDADTKARKNKAEKSSKMSSSTDGTESKKPEDGKSKKSKKSSSDKKKKTKKTKNASGSCEEKLESFSNAKEQSTSSAFPLTTQIQVTTFTASASAPAADYLHQIPAALCLSSAQCLNNDFEQQRHLDNQLRQERIRQTIERLRLENEKARAQRIERQEAHA